MHSSCFVINRSLVRHGILVFCMTLLSLLAACGGSPTQPPAASDTPATPASSQEATGASIFNEVVLERNGTAVQGCVACHLVDPSIGENVGMIGPNLAGVATRATERAPGTTAEEYLRTSIVDPAAYNVEGFDSSTKPTNYGELLTSAELDSLVAYLMTLK